MKTYFYTAKLDELYMRDRNYEHHLKTLAQIQSRGANRNHDSLNRNISHMHERRRDYDWDVKKEDITKKNARLLSRIIEIQQRRSRSQLNDDDPSFLHYKNFYVRKNEAIKIAQENEKMANRLIRLQSQIKIAEEPPNKVRLQKFQLQANYAQQIRLREFPQLQQLSKEIHAHDTTTQLRLKTQLRKKKKRKSHSLQNERIYINKQAILSEISQEQSQVVLNTSNLEEGKDLENPAEIVHTQAGSKSNQSGNQNISSGKLSPFYGGTNSKESVMSKKSSKRNALINRTYKNSRNGPLNKSFDAVRHESEYKRNSEKRNSFSGM